MATVAKEEEKQLQQHSDKITIQRDRSGHYGLHISNISAEINEMDLRSLFESSGFVKICKIIKTYDNDRVAFVKFLDQEEAVRALNKLNGTKLGGSIITVRPAYESQKSRGNRYYKERTNSSESLSKSRDRKGHQNHSGNERTSPKDEKTVNEQKHLRKDENCDVFYTSQDVRHTNNTSDMSSAPTSSSGKNGVQNIPGTKSIENTSTQLVYSIATGSSGENYVQSAVRSRSSDLAQSNGTPQSYSQRPNTAQRFAGPQGNHPVTSSNSSQMFSTGRPSPSRGCSYQNSSITSPRLVATANNDAQNGYNYPGGVNNNYYHSLSNKTQTGNPYTMHNGTPSSQFSPTCEISKPMRDLSLSNPGSMYGPSNVSKWSVKDVINHFNIQEECSKSMVDFLEEQEIDGNALMLLEQDSLLHFMKLGPALKLLNLRDKLKH
ncbi:polycomb protein Scm-like [Actinia tenebrosa]|uniref:Polycomb protein Scm-like n=1 Tax=Actinia tenebrosa TaxID=6105 RepID=A0A6P8J3N7_ACTTE|nr:polycomb protein Scm-like [Actinia tenebrosa]